jgi:hypothetical protein
VNFISKAAIKLSHKIRYFSLTETEDFIMELYSESLLLVIAFMSLIVAFYLLKPE